jgi:hypothetical protein
MLMMSRHFPRSRRTRPVISRREGGMDENMRATKKYGRDSFMSPRCVGNVVYEESAERPRRTNLTVFTGVLHLVIYEKIPVFR